MVCCRAELESREEAYDVIIGDLADPIEGGPCYKLYTKSFYEFTVKPRLNQGGIFVTQVCMCMERRKITKSQMTPRIYNHWHSMLWLMYNKSEAMVVVKVLLH